MPSPIGPANRGGGTAVTDVYRNPHLTPGGGPVGHLPALPDRKWGCRQVAGCHCSKQLGTRAGSKALATSFPGSWPIGYDAARGMVAKYPREGWPKLATAGIRLQWDNGKMGEGKRVGSIPACAGEPVMDKPSTPGTAVYPRVGGGTGQQPKRPPEIVGLSPRGRGNQHDSVEKGAVPGSIPAWAGEPTSRWQHDTRSKVYPRVGGGTSELMREIEDARGLSPRGRGNHGYPGCPSVQLGSIPAWAGEPRPIRRRSSGGRVYPRVGGGTHSTPPMPYTHTGLSPRGRGNRFWSRSRTWPVRSIPAWAGEPLDCTQL